MPEQILKTIDLGKKYRKTEALGGIDLTVCRGDIYGLIGRNGAGKTTFLKIIGGLIPDYDGSYELFGKSGREATVSRIRMGCLIDSPAFFPNFSAYQNLKYYCVQKGITDNDKIVKILETVGLGYTGMKKYKTFSLGMKQRLGIAFALLDDPEFVILDEPINGLDPMGISDMRNLFLRLNRENNVTFIISSHILSELYSVANKFLIIDRGRIIREISKDELDRECKRGVNIVCDDVKTACVIIENELGISDFVIADDRSLNVYSEIETSVLTRLLVNNDIDVYRITQTGVSLEEFYRNLIGEK